MPIIALHFGIQLLIFFIFIILFLIFKFTTVKRLRQNTKTKYSLGLEFFWGWDVINVAQAITLPEWLINRLKKSRFPNFFADADLMREHTNKQEKLLAKTIYITFFLNGIYIIVTSLLFQFGFFDIS